MRSVGVRELKEHASRILEEVRQRGEEVQITRHGRVIARLVPVPQTAPDEGELDVIWSDMDRLAEEIESYWPQQVTATEAVAEGRREP
ncbi:MAG: type II toxin-antitoxin system Phd/YefM family antitoxin [Chloroflexota bacterium]